MDLEAAVAERVRKGAFKVPPSPVVALRLAKLLNDENSSLDDLVEAVKQDQALAGIVLRMANSAAYRRLCEVVTLPAAVALLGRKNLTQVALARVLHEEAMARGALLPVRRRVWRESLVAAQVAQWCAEEEGLQGDDAFTAALLHDIGRLPVISCLEELLKAHPEADTRTEDGWLELVDTFHAEAGRRVAAEWQLPARLCEVIAQHHDDGPRGRVMELVRAADQVVRLMDGEPLVPVERLGQVAELSTATCEALHRRLHLLPAYLDAFAESPGADPKPVVDYELQVSVEGESPIHVTVHADGLVHGANVVTAGPQLLLLWVDLRPSQVVRVRWDELDFHARVTASDGGACTLSPWALSETQLAGWERLVGAVHACLDKSEGVSVIMAMP